MPSCSPAPLLHVRLTGPEGLQVTVFPGTTKGRTFDAPANLGLRPGYIQRLKLTGFPDHPNAALYPTFEVVGSLRLPSRLKAADYPAVIEFREEEVERTLTGSVITKVVYLEDPDTSAPRNDPVELGIRPGRDPVAEARLHGRPLLVVRLGGREAKPEELARWWIPGTVLLPGQTTLSQPVCPSWLPWTCVPFHDPFLGPRPPAREYLRDGSDRGERAGIGPDGRLRGLDPSDAVAEYSTLQGRRVAVSNRVAVFVPRFGVVHGETLPAGYNTTVATGDASVALAQSQLTARQPSLQTRQTTQLDALSARQRPSETEVIQGGAVVVGRVDGIRIVSNMQETRNLTAIANTPPRELERFPAAKPLLLQKWADKQAAQIGDEVTFWLKYSNLGGQPINDLAVSDSLTGRLAYIQGSAQSDRDAVFTIQENEAGSLILRWEITGALLPGQSGTVRFKARVR